MTLMEAGAPAPQITVLGAGAPVGAVVVVSLVGLAIYALYVLRPAIERWASAGKVPAPSMPPCAGCCAMAGIDAEQIAELLRHNERLYQTMHEGTAFAADGAPITLIRYTHGKVETIAEWVKRQQAAEEARDEADRREVAEAVRRRREDTDPGGGRKPR